MTAPLTEQDLAEIAADYRMIVEHPVKVPSQIVRMADNVPRLLAEVRRLREDFRRCRQEAWCPGLPVACQKHVDQARGALRELEDERDTHRADRDVALALKSAAERDLAEWQADLARGAKRLQLEHAVVEAAKAWLKDTAESVGITPRQRELVEVVLALEKLEAPR